MSSSDYSPLHQRILRNFISQLNEREGEDSPFVLKGGNSLVQCYGLNRLSGDIDLDAAHEESNRRRFLSAVKAICSKNGWEYRIAKDTDTVGRVLIHYSTDEAPLKVEVSYRNRNIPENTIANVNGIRVYNIDRLAQMKCAAYSNRDRVRDLVDLCFIYQRYKDQLSDVTKQTMKATLEYKGLDQVEYLLATQHEDVPYDDDKVIDLFLNTCDGLGLIEDRPSTYKERPAI